MRRYLDLFLAEARDHLTAAVALLQSVERRQQDDDTPRELMRRAHSLKGMAAAMGYSDMADLAHATEDLLEQLAKSGTGAPGSSSEALARSFSCLETIVTRVERGEEPDAPEAAALIERLRGQLSQRGAEADRQCDVAAEPEQVQTAEARASSWRVELRLDPDRVDSAEATVAVIGRVAAVGRVLRAWPPLLSGSTGGFEGRLRLILASSRTRPALAEELARVAGVMDVSVSPEPEHDVAAEEPNRTTAWIRLPAERLDFLLDRILELKVQHGRTRQALRSPLARKHLERSDRSLREIYTAVMELRLVPFETVSDRLRQHAADLGRTLGKNISLEIVGSQVRLDRRVLDALVDPLMHMVRNAIDHGVESPEGRRAAGKPIAGRLRLALERSGDRIHVTLEDDGRGMDPETVRERAVARGLIQQAEARRLGDDEALLLTTLPGFSTADKLTLISGRGVGLDVVRNFVDRLGGLLTLSSAPGSGTHVRLSVPLSLALIRALLVRCGEQLCALPIDAVIRTSTLPAVTEGDAGSATIWLGERLGLDGYVRPPTNGRAIRVSCPAGEAVLAVDQVLGTQDVIVKPFPAPLIPLPTSTGAALTEDGSLAFIVDPAQLAPRALDAG